MRSSDKAAFGGPSVVLPLLSAKHICGCLTKGNRDPRGDQSVLLRTNLSGRYFWLEIFVVILAGALRCQIFEGVRPLGWGGCE